jgi:hypothetical protein
MAISISVTDVWKLLDRRKENKEALSKWLDEVARDARALADIWSKTCVELKAGTFNVDGELLRTMELHRPPNGSYFQRLILFYASLSSVFQGRTRGIVWVNAVAEELGGILKTRGFAAESYERMLSGVREAYFADSENKLTDLSDLEKAAHLLNREAAALEVLAANFKATG